MKDSMAMVILYNELFRDNFISNYSQIPFTATLLLTFSMFKLVNNYAIYQLAEKRVLMTCATLLHTPHALTKILTHMAGYQEEKKTFSVH